MQSRLRLGLLHWQPALPGQLQRSSRWRSCLSMRCLRLILEAVHV